ncbi:hypothetical protein E2C01_097206 [Portunus trituberculatus]|uniref:Uncharacterized protein n=1 Tax=Portunus trituberculatus TaxID=210409 RepID=A0A5B7K8Y8_PORTR|nr:hypothetical protein [Portunus trituberculatus]
MHNRRFLCWRPRERGSCSMALLQDHFLPPPLPIERPGLPLPLQRLGARHEAIPGLRLEGRGGSEKAVAGRRDKRGRRGRLNY